jgi:hypothetical protein
MRKSDIPSMPQYFNRYIDLADDIDLLSALEKYDEKYFLAEESSLRKLGKQVYAENKWTISDIIQHVIDTERIFTYRALRIGRKDKTNLPGFDENSYADEAHGNDRSFDDLIEEFKIVRQSTIALFKSFNPTDVIQESSVSNSPISPIALGYTSVGHVIHHVSIIKERYYPLIK